MSILGCVLNSIWEDAKDFPRRHKDTLKNIFIGIVITLLIFAWVAFWVNLGIHFFGKQSLFAPLLGIFGSLSILPIGYFVWYVYDTYQNCLMRAKNAPKNT